MSAQNILFVTRMLSVGGAERQLVELATGLHQRGWKVSVATFYGGGVLEGDLKKAGIRLIDLHKRGRWNIVQFMWRLVKVVRAERPDIIHGYLDFPNILIALLRPVFHETRVVWGIRASNMDFARYDWLAAVEFRLGVWLSRLAHLIICNSHAGLAHHAKHGYPRDRMVVIPNGIDIERFKPDHQARQALRAEWSVDADERLIGLVARLDPMKDHENFLRAAAKVAEVRREAKFVCVGAGAHAYAAALRQLGDALGLHERLLWVGERIDVPRIYNALDISVSSSVSGEGFPNAVAESMATGICCVVTDVGDSAKLVGNSGFVCAPNDSPALAHAILDALDALRVDSTAVRQRICSEFTSSALIERTIPYLVHLLRDSAPCPANP